jgi:hypothetical protein
MSGDDLNTIVDQRQVSLSGADEDVRCINKVMQVSTGHGRRPMQKSSLIDNYWNKLGNRDGKGRDLPMDQIYIKTPNPKFRLFLKIDQ